MLWHWEDLKYVSRGGNPKLKAKMMHSGMSKKLTFLLPPPFPSPSLCHCCGDIKLGALEECRETLLHSPMPQELQL